MSVLYKLGYRTKMVPASTNDWERTDSDDAKRENPIPSINLQGTPFM